MRIQITKLPNNKKALGGILQSHGSDWGSGLVHIDAGSTHENNKYEGVQMGVDPNGNPNLVEENEVVYDDFVYSMRIPIDDTTKEHFHISKKKDMTYAELAKLLERKNEVNEKPNDAIAQAGFSSQMKQLAEDQERQKAEMEAERARQAFEALSPEEQTALMANMAQQQQGNVSAYGGNLFQRGGKFPNDDVPDSLGTDSVAIKKYLSENMGLQGNELIQKAAQIAMQRRDVLNTDAAKNWLYKNVQGVGKSTLDAVAEMMAATLGGHSVDTEFNAEKAFKKIVPTGYFSEGNISKYLQKFKDKGINVDDALTLVHTYNRDKSNASKRTYWNSMDSRLRADYIKESAPLFQQEVAQQQPQASVQQQQTQPVVTAPTFNPYQFTQPAQSAQQTLVLPGSGVAPAVTPKAASMQTQAAAPTVEEAPAAPAVPTATAAPVTQPTVVIDAEGNLHTYSGYGSNYDTPTGFTVGDNGRIDKKTGYSQEYRDLVNQLGADDLRAWVEAHPQDASYLSFVASGNDINKITDAQFRKGAQDGVYGFMHHVADALLQDEKNSIALNNAINEGNPQNPIEGTAPIPDRDTQVYIVTDKGITPVDASTLDDTYDIEDYEGVKLARKKTVTSEGEKKEGDNKKDEEPRHRWEGWRYAGLFGPAVGLGMMAAGVGKPDYSELNAAVALGNSGVRTANWKPIGNYLTYRPMDIWAEQNRMDANARATDRAILNSVSPSKYAGLLANAYNNQLAAGELYRKALEYNDAKRAQVAEFNRGTDLYNSQAYNQNQQFNAEALNRNRQYNAQLAMSAAQQKLAGDAAWYNSLYGNIGGLFRGLSDLGTENARLNMVSALAADGYTNLGDSYTGDMFLKRDKNKKNNGNV